MSNSIGFRIVCTNCGCLSVRIEEPLKADRESIVYCGDCGASRGTMGALRDIATLGHRDGAFPMASSMSSLNGKTADEPASADEISRRYAELRRLRQQVEIAEWLARESIRTGPARRSRRTDARNLAFRPVWHPQVTSIKGERDHNRPR